MAKKYDFSGWATKVDLRCTDGRTIRKDAFKHCDGHRVPLVWQHQHNDPENVLGYADLEYHPEGVRANGLFNSSPKGQHGKLLVEHGDIAALSIYANSLEQRGGDVLHGDIKEVSLVLAGANPGALIDFPVLAHSGEEVEDEAIIYTGLPLTLMHADDDAEDEDESGDDNDKFDDEEEDDDEESGDDGGIEHADDEGETVGEVFDTLTDKQKNAVYALVSEIMHENNDNDDDFEGEDDMKHNVFDTETKAARPVLSHDDFKRIAADAKRLGSMKEAVLAHMEDENGVLAHAVGDIADRNGNAVNYGIADIDYLFPEAKSLNNPPDFIQRDMGWVRKVIGGTHHTPFSRVKSMFANITMEEARARGYIKGNLKKEEVFTLLKRSTDPQTVYKKQKMDRDDMIDITGFDVVRWIKGEMRMMLEEELARAFLIGDGRGTAEDDHISHDHIRPIATDADLYTIKKGVTAGADDAATAKNFIRTAIKARKDYKGSGNPTLFTTEDMLAEMLLLEDNMAHFLYTSEAQLATTLRVKEIVTVPVLEGFQIDNKDVLGIIVNLSDYNVGADKGGETATFEDFDIDYNQYKYLIETRCSGALVKPFSAITLIKSGTDSSTTVLPNRVTGATGATGET